MRRIYFILSVCGILSSCCDKGETETKEFKATGRWKLIEVTGGITGSGTLTQWNELELTEDSYKFYNDNTLLVSGKLTQITAANCDKINFVTNQIVDPPILDIISSPEKCTEINSNGELLLISDCCDNYDYRLSKK